VVSWLARFWVVMAVHLWQTALFVGALYLVSRALRRAEARTRSTLYWIGVLKLLLPLPYLGVLTDAVVDSFAGSMAAAPVEPGWTVTVLMYPALFEVETASWTGPGAVFWVGLTAAWFLGSVTCLSRRARAWLSRLRLAAGYGLVTSAKLSGAIADAGLDPGHVRVDRSGLAPFVTGNRRPVIVFPQRAVEAFSREDLRAVLLHEREHLRRRDPLRYSVLWAVHAVFWFFPPLWWLERRIRETTEMACDEAVLQAGVDPADYARALARMLGLGLSRRHGIGAMGRHPSAALVRIRTLLEQRRTLTMPAHRLTVAASAIAAVVFSLLPLAPVPTLQAGDEATPAAGLERLADADLPVMLNFTKTEAGKIFESLGKVSGVTFVLDEEVAAKPVTINVGRVPLAMALTRLGQAAGVTYEVTDPRRVEVRPALLAGMDGVTLPVLIPESKVKPVYPEKEREERIEGRVILQALIDATGAVRDLEALNVTPAGNEAFPQSAIDAVGQWRYEPATRDGEPVDVYFTIRVDFQLK